MSKHADANNGGVHIPVKNSSQSHKQGHSIIREAMRGTEGREMAIGGGCKDPGGDRKPRKEDGGT